MYTALRYNIIEVKHTHINILYIVVYVCAFYILRRKVAGDI